MLAASLVWLTASGAACGRIGHASPPETAVPPPLPGQRSDVFTTARPSILVALREHFGILPAATQPVEFPHDAHIVKAVSCTTCHTTVTRSAVAGLPGIKTCMKCHETVVAGRPRIQRISQMADKGLDLSWQRVYGYVPQAHVRFNHAPHVRAKVECSTCHGDVGKQTVTRRNVDLNMGFCVTCHRANSAPDDCLTCHT
jgi:hypothetical protein